ncbi:MAG TPA: proline--tRNA ligase [Tetragenococcus sp.]|nr:proline--tRNA ligase [Tetragenococcus sp.]
MKQSKLLIPTLRQISEDAYARNLQLLLRAGFIRQASKGIYTYLPLAMRVLTKIENIIIEEFEKVGAVQIKMPTLIPSSIVKKDKENNSYQIRNSHGIELLLGSKYAELLSDLVGNEVLSYKRLPLTMFQVDTKYRNDKRPKHGLMRSHEFIMVDAYSFHKDEESLAQMYAAYQEAFTRVFSRLGVKVKRLLGSSHLEQGKDALEYMCLSKFGDKIACFSENGDYAAELSVATSEFSSHKSHESYKELASILQKDADLKKMAQVLELPLKKGIRTVPFLADQKPILLLIRADQKINRLKVKKQLELKKLTEMDEEQLQAYLKTPLQNLGPVGVPFEIPIYADRQIQELANAFAGANKSNTFLQNVNPERDFKVSYYADFRLVQEGDPAPDNSGQLVFKKATEVGRMVKTGLAFSQKTDNTVLDEKGQITPVLMGYYELGVTRLLAMIAEQNNDGEGINWPLEIAPFDLHIVQTKMNDDWQSQLTGQIEEMMTAQGYQVLVDDRDVRSGVKFADADLIGCPVRITVGNKAEEGIINIKFKRSQESMEVKKEELVSTLKILLNTEN